MKISKDEAAEIFETREEAIAGGSVKTAEQRAKEIQTRFDRVLLDKCHLIKWAIGDTSHLGDFAKRQIEEAQKDIVKKLMLPLTEILACPDISLADLLRRLNVVIKHAEKIIKL